MTPAEFRRIATSSGYACAHTADKFIEQTNKDSYTQDDFVELYRFDAEFKAAQNRNNNGKWRDYQGVRTTKHLITLGDDERGQ